MSNFEQSLHFRDVYCKSTSILKYFGKRFAVFCANVCLHASGLLQCHYFTQILPLQALGRIGVFYPLEVLESGL